MKGYTL